MMIQRKRERLRELEDRYVDRQIRPIDGQIRNTDRQTTLHPLQPVFTATSSALTGLGFLGVVVCER